MKHLEELPPHAYALVESLRSMGYTPPTALADLVDNSITAKARNIQIQVAPDLSGRNDGHVSVEDDGEGLSEEELWESMRWGGAGPGERRQAHDLGRFGLGMKTASVSMGTRLTVASRKRAGSALNVMRWDLRHVIDSGKWYPLDGPDRAAEPVIARSLIGRDAKATGTIVVTTDLDRFGVKSALASHATRNEAALLKKIRSHLGMVFHRYMDDGLVVRLGATRITSWDPFAGGTLRDREILDGKVEVSSFVMAHHSKVTTEEFDRMAGPSGWGAHQGFIIYRARRLIVPGGWLRLFQPIESCRLARIRIELPNDLDATWGLNVMKSSVTPPSWVLADLMRIGEATRRDAMVPFRFRGDRQAPAADANGAAHTAFWNQVSGKDDVRFRINRAHPVVQSLKHAMREAKLAEPFLTAFERLLPLEAILQDPKRTTNGSGQEPDEKEVAATIQLAKFALRLLRSQGHDQAGALEAVLASEPFCWHAERLRKELA